MTNHMTTQKTTAELMPCPFCGSKDIKTDLKGTQPSISCNDCGDGFVSIQTSDHFTDEERFNDPDFQFRYDPHFDYGIKGTQRALDVLTERWNTRYNADRLAELEAALTWQPIETAPKSLDPVLVFVPNIYEAIHPIYKGAIYVGWRFSDGKYTVFSNGKGVQASVVPTMWMPLPKPPQALQHKGEA